MTNETTYNNVSVLIVGAGPAGLAAAITLKKNKPDLEWLAVYSTPVKSLRPVRKNRNIKFLNIMNTRIQRLDPVEDNSQL